MSIKSDAEPAYTTAVERFKQGQCPGCGKGFGQPRGLEYRKGPDDLYCHTCKLSWPMELDQEMLRARLSVAESAAPRTYEEYEASPGRVVQPQVAPQAAGMAARLGRLFRRILMG